MLLKKSSKQLIKYGVKISVQVVEEFITKVQQCKESSYNETKDVVYGRWETAKVTVGLLED